MALLPTQLAQFLSLAKQCPGVPDAPQFLPSSPLSYDFPYPARIVGPCLITCTSGATEITVNRTSFSLHARTSLLILPGQFLAAISPGAYLSIMSFPAEEADCAMAHLYNALPSLLDSSCDAAITFPLLDATPLSACIKLLSTAFSRPGSPLSQKEIESLLCATLYEIILYRQSCRISPTARRDVIMTRFLQEVSRRFLNHREVSFYASLLQLSPKHLSATTKETSGLTAGEWIDFFLIEESKIALAGSLEPVQIVAERLRFSNQSFFGKFFKHHVGLSPKAFRKLALQASEASQGPHFLASTDFTNS